MKKPAILAALITSVIASTSFGFASQAQDLFDEATYRIGFFYNGLSGPIEGGYRALRRQYQPQLDAACTGEPNCPFEKALPIIQMIIANLKDPFTQLISEEMLETYDRLNSGQGPATPRLGLIAHPNTEGLVIVDVFEREPAAEAKLERGDVIKTINAQTATLERLHTLEQSEEPLKLEIMRAGAVRMIEITPRTAEQGRLATVRESGTPGVRVIRVPDLWATSDARVSASNRFLQLVQRATNDRVRGLIIDLRDSDTGDDLEALLMASGFISEYSFVYKRRFLDEEYRITIKGNEVYQQIKGEEAEKIAERSHGQVASMPVVVLVNEHTVNSAEMLAYFLQSTGRVRVVGTPTAGQLSVSGGLIARLINDDVLRLSIQRPFQANGTLFPERVNPDEIVQEDLTALSQGRDVQLERAIALLNLR